MKLAVGAKRIVATKGKKVISIDMAKDKPDAETLAGLIVGPSGNLRAPAAWVGKTLMVGFDPEMYQEVLSAEC